VNWLTRAEAIAIDGHFVVEQRARSVGSLPMSFNGSAGVWRAAAIDDAGGWLPCTLAEDLDLSYRAQLRGWRIAYLPDVVVPAELPVRHVDYRQQQARWAHGTTHNLRLHVRAVWRSRYLSLPAKVMATAHLAQYVPQIALLGLVLLSPLVGVLHLTPHLPFGATQYVFLNVPLMFALALFVLRDRPLHRLLAFPALLVLANSVLLSNARAAWDGLLCRPAVFARTPKQGDQVVVEPAIHGSPWGERALCAYLLLSALLLAHGQPAFAALLAFQAGCFLLTAWHASSTPSVRRIRPWVLRETPAVRP
jgi:hypothetical protein